MKMRNVKELSGCKYVEVTDAGLVIEQDGSKKTLEVRNISYYIDMHGAGHLNTE